MSKSTVCYCVLKWRPPLCTLMCLLTSLPSYSPSHTGNQTRPADPPSGCISGRPSPRHHGNRGHTGEARPSSGGTNSVAHNHSVSKGYQQNKTYWPSTPFCTISVQTWRNCLGKGVLLLIYGRWLPPWSSLSKDTFTIQQLSKVVRLEERLKAVQHQQFLLCFVIKWVYSRVICFSLYLRARPVESRDISSWRTWQTATSGPCSLSSSKTCATDTNTQNEFITSGTGTLQLWTGNAACLTSYFTKDIHSLWFIIHQEV